MPHRSLMKVDLTEEYRSGMWHSSHIYQLSCGDIGSEHEYQQKSYNFQIFAGLCICVTHEKKVINLFYIHDMLYPATWLWPNIWWNSSALSLELVCSPSHFLWIEYIFFRAERSLESCRQGCGPFVCANTTIIFALSACALVLVYLILFDLFLEHHHFLSMDSNELFFTFFCQETTLRDPIRHAAAAQ